MLGSDVELKTPSQPGTGAVSRDCLAGVAFQHGACWPHARTPVLHLFILTLCLLEGPPGLRERVGNVSMPNEKDPPVWDVRLVAERPTAVGHRGLCVNGSDSLVMVHEFFEVASYLPGVQYPAPPPLSLWPLPFMSKRGHA